MDYYRFDIKNTGDLDLYASIYLEDDKTSSLIYTINHGTDTTYTKTKNGNTTEATESGTNEFSRTETFSSFVGTDEYKYFKVAIIESGTTVATVQTYENIVDNDYMVMSQIPLASGETKTYYMYIWLSKDESVDESEREACSEATETYNENQTSANLTAMNTACQRVKSNEVIGKYFVSELYAKGEYKHSRI